MHKSPCIAALIVAAGTGSRAGGKLPKQYRIIGGKALLRYSVEALANHPAITQLQVVIHPDHETLYRAATAGLNLLPPVYGGAMRSDSVNAGLAALATHIPDYVLIHDAARPFLTHAMLDALIAALDESHAALPALPIADTVRRHAGSSWQEVNRDGLMRMQTPQAFPFNMIRSLVSASPAATDEAAIWLAAGKPLRYVMGDERLRKVTDAADILWAENHAAGTRRTVVGMGYDVHALIPSPAGTIRLGGVDIPHTHMLDGHSDADVVLHAIVDALLGTIALGDIGSHFPPSDVRWKGANSAIFIAEALKQVAVRGGSISHLDVTVIGERPKISPHREAMRTTIASLLHLPLHCISVKATTTEKLGFTGREEGIACQAIATVTLPAESA